MEEQLELLMREYELYGVDCLDSYRDVVRYLKGCSGNIAKSIRELEFERHRNSFFGKHAREFRKLLNYKSSSFFKTSNIFVGKLIDICNGYRSFFDSLTNSVSEDNYPEVYRLARFTNDKYEYDVELVQDNSDNALCRFNGICFPDRDDEIVLGAVFKAFFNKEVRRISEHARYEKVKK